MKLVRYQLEKDIQGATMANREWLKSRLCEILESSKESTSKADYLGLSLLSIDESVASIEEEVKELKALKDSLKQAKEVALEVGASVFEGYGIERLEGLRISSLTLTKSIEKTKHRFTIKNESELIRAGFTKTVVDTEAVKIAYEGGQYRGLIESCCDIEVITTPAVTKLKVNRRRSKPSELNDSINLEEAA